MKSLEQEALPKASLSIFGSVDKFRSQRFIIQIFDYLRDVIITPVANEQLQI